jgi:hypothetical protein
VALCYSATTPSQCEAASWYPLSPSRLLTQQMLLLLRGDQHEPPTLQMTSKNTTLLLMLLSYRLTAFAANHQPGPCSTSELSCGSSHVAVSAHSLSCGPRSNQTYIHTQVKFITATHSHNVATASTPQLSHPLVLLVLLLLWLCGLVARGQHNDYQHGTRGCCLLQALAALADLKNCRWLGLQQLMPAIHEHPGAAQVA